MKVLVLGIGGMLGHKVFLALRERFPRTVGTLRASRRDLPCRRIEFLQGKDVLDGVDARDLPALTRLLQEHRPDVLVNCVGVVKQRAEAQAPIPTLTLNALLPHVLAETCRAWGGRLVHFSTDCVFSGKRGGYTESDPSDAEDLYGKTKALGEATEENALTLRTSIIGRELTHFESLLEWFLAQRGTIKGFTRAMYSGVTTNHLARVVADLLAADRRLTGLYQVTGETISKHDLLQLLKDAYRSEVEIVPDDSFVCDRSMDGKKFRDATGCRCPPWPELVSALASDPTPYASWR